MKSSSKITDRRNFLKSSAHIALGVPLLGALRASGTDVLTDPDNQVEFCIPIAIFNSMVNWVHQQPENLFLLEGVRMKKSTSTSWGVRDYYISYFDGIFSYNEQRGFFEEDFQQLFSDRFANHQPFDKNRADILNIRLSVVGQNCRVRYILKSWGNYTGTFTPKCAGGRLVGYDSDGLYWVLSFFKKSVPL